MGRGMWRGGPGPARRLGRALAVASVAVALGAGIPGGAYAGESGRPGAPGRSVSLRAVTLNIQAGADANHVFDVAAQIEALRGMRADVIALQEVDVHWSARSEWRDLATEIAGGLDMNVFFGPIYDLDPLTGGAPRREFGIAILSRHPILHAENHWITRLSTQVPDPEPAPAPGFPEVVINARGAHVHVYSTHLDYRGDPTVRQMQVADMLRIMAEDAGQRQILLGDFNARPDAAELAPLWSYVADTWPVGGSGPGLTYPASAPDRRIDYVTVTGRVAVCSVRAPASTASDHLPVVADLAVTRGGNGRH